MKSQQIAYIQLDNGEDVPSVRDRLSFFRGQRVLIIWPEQGTALIRKIDLVLIQREARRRVLQLALVTHDSDVINHATELGISTFETINEAESTRWKRGRTRVFINRHHRPDDAPDPDELKPLASRIRNSKKRLPPVLQILLRVSILAIVIAVLLGTLYITVPSATVTFSMEQELIQVETTITADPTVLDIDVENRIIPATRYEVTVQALPQIETTGIEQGSSTRAIGSVTFSNRTNSPVLVPVGTIVRTSAGQIVDFETTTIATIPSNDTVSGVGIMATEDFLGEIGNVATSTIGTIVGDLSNTLTVSNDFATSGGVNRDIQTVTLEDMERLMGNARQYLQGLAYTEIEADLSDTQTIIIESLNIPDELLRDDWITFSHMPGDETNLLTLDIRVIVEALVIDDRFAQQVVFAQVSGQRPDDMILNPESFLYLRGAVIETDEENRTTFQAFGEGIATAQVDVYRLQSDLTRRSLDDAQRLIAATVDIAPNAQPIIEIQPRWLNHMPFLPIRIDVQIEGDE